MPADKRSVLAQNLAWPLSLGLRGKRLDRASIEAEHLPEGFVVVSGRHLVV